MSALNHMAPLRALVSSLHKGRSLEERVRVARLKREGMRRATAVPGSSSEEAIDLSDLDDPTASLEELERAVKEAVNTTTTEEEA